MLVISIGYAVSGTAKITVDCYLCLYLKKMLNFN